AWQRQSTGPNLVRLGLRLGNPEAGALALKLIADEKVADRTGLIEVLGQVREEKGVPLLLEIFEKSGSVSLRNAALSALEHFPDRGVAGAILEIYPRLNAELRQRARNALCSRPTWSHALLD